MRPRSIRKPKKPPYDPRRDLVLLREIKVAYMRGEGGFNALSIRFKVDKAVIKTALFGGLV